MSCRCIIALKCWVVLYIHFLLEFIQLFDIVLLMIACMGPYGHTTYVSAAQFTPYELVNSISQQVCT